MKNLKLLIAGISAAVLVTGCGVTQDGFSSASMQKRKYTKGFYISKRSHLKAKQEKSTGVSFTDESTIQNEEVVALKKRNIETTSASKHQLSIQHPVSNENNVQTTEKSVAKNSRNESSNALSNEKSEKQLKTATHKEVKNVLKKHRPSSHSSGDDLLILCIILAILIPPLGVGVWTNIDWTKVLICLLLTLLFFLPGMIYALLVVLDKI